MLFKSSELKKKGRQEEIIKEAKLKKGVKVTENLITTTKELPSEVNTLKKDS